jgi:hypothetical protein
MPPETFDLLFVEVADRPVGHDIALEDDDAV